MKVNFIIAGFQKCGTTALHTFLSSHPKIIGSYPKELDFFSYDENYKKGVKYYHSYFENKLLSALRGFNYLESSPSYICDKNPTITAKRIKQYNSDIKIIVLIRNPVDRAYSAWNMYKKRFEQGNKNWWFDWLKEREGDYPKAIRRTSLEYMDFSLFINNEIKAIENKQRIECPVLEAGFYMDGIEIFKDCFEDNMLVISNEELDKNTSSTLKKIEKFLKIDPYNWSNFNESKVFKGGYNKNIPKKIVKELEGLYIESNLRLYKLTGIKYF